jgi:hypothetical protein
VSVFLLARTFERGNLHSTGMSRFIATPVPVPLRDSRLHSSSHVACSYSGARPKSLPASQGCSMIVAGSMLSETPGAWTPLSYSAQSHMACSLGQNDRQSTQTFPFSGLRVRFRTHTRHLVNSYCKQQYRAAGSALPGKAYREFMDRTSLVLFKHGSEPG